MKILIEGEKYSLDSLQNIFDDPKFYHQENNEGKITSVGYYHSYDRGELIYMLPKVFMVNSYETVFGISKDDLFNIEQSESFKHKEEYNWIRQISVYFYKSLLEYKRRNSDNSILQSSLTSNINTHIGNQEYTYLDLILSFINFYKKNKNIILFKQINFKSKQVKNTNWERTITKSIPLITRHFQPIYDIYRNKKKHIDSEEELLTYYFSILNHFKIEHSLFIQIDKRYAIIKGSQFKQLQIIGLLKLRKIKYKYFNDTMKRIYHLCELYFTFTDKSSINKKREEFISVNNYNIVFEDMIDKLFSDPIIDKKTKDGVSLKSLKYNEDGKIVDHVFDYQSILDTSDIFYIGDSKYYKSENSAGKTSKYKQFTYAKNVIQYNIDLLNETGGYYTKNLRYRDEITEGYNITPNFFIYGYISDFKNFDDNDLDVKGEIVKSYHFKDRLFDRDTLFVHQYKINFLYVLKSYTQLRVKTIEDFRINTKKIFRQNFIDYFSNQTMSEFILYTYQGSNYSKFIEQNFRILNGKCYVTVDNKLILAKHNSDKTLDNLIQNFLPFLF